MIEVIICGGTIDKVYSSTLEKFVIRQNISEIPSILRNASIEDIHFSTMLMPRMDSSEMGDEDREHILKACKMTRASKILITHGTDTMDITARFLSKLRQKTIVLTGAFKPALLKDSDAQFNIGSAITALRLLPPGVFICMNGRVFPWHLAKKDRKKGRFVQKQLPKEVYEDGMYKIQ